MTIVSMIKSKIIIIIAKISYLDITFKIYELLANVYDLLFIFLASFENIPNVRNNYLQL